MFIDVADCVYLWTYAGGVLKREMVMANTFHCIFELCSFRNGGGILAAVSIFLLSEFP
jgi:hypothetical protein